MDADAVRREPGETDARYAAFLLRVWRGEGEDAWRVVIEHVGADDRRGFTEWAELVAYVRRVLVNPAAAG